MNKQQRKALEDFVGQLDTIQCALLEMSEVERDKYDNMPESLQGSEKGEALDSASFLLEEMAGDICNVIDNLNQII